MLIQLFLPYDGTDGLLHVLPTANSFREGMGVDNALYSKRVLRPDTVALVDLSTCTPNKTNEKSYESAGWNIRLDR